MRSLALILSLLGFASPLMARVGLVRTADGHVWEGQVRFTPESIVIVNVEHNTITSVPLTNVSMMTFPPSPAETNAADEPLDESLPPGWREADIGIMQLAGSTRHESGTFTVRSSGRNIDGDSDSFHYVFKSVRGDSEIVAEVSSIQYTHPNAKAGLMIRENLTEYSPHVMLAMTAERGGFLQVRAQDRAAVDATPVRPLFAPQWLKLKRHGDEFSAYYSSDGRRWSLLEKTTVALRENIYVGLAVASARDNMLNWTTFRKVRESPKLLNEDFAPQVELISGSVVTGRPEFADENEIVFPGAPKAVRVPTDRVARIIWQPLIGDIAWKTRVSRPGVWVNTGDFFDGDFRGLANRRLTVSSVLYGLRSFDVDDEVMAVILQPRRTRRTTYEIETTDGATLLATDLTLGDGEVKVREAALGELRLPAFEIVELRRR